MALEQQRKHQMRHRYVESESLAELGRLVAPAETYTSLAEAPLLTCLVTETPQSFHPGRSILLQESLSCSV